MKLLKQATELYNLKSSKRVVYEDVEFFRGFTEFLESLVLNKLIGEDYKRIPTDGGFQWADKRKTGGLLIETSDHPILNKWPDDLDKTSKLIFEGLEESLELVESIMHQHGVKTTTVQENLVVDDISDSGIDWSGVNLSTEKQVFEVDNNPVYEYDGGKQTVLIMKINEEPVAYLTYSKMTLYGYTYNYLDRAFTEPKFRGKGYALKMIIQLRKVTNIKILGDEQVTNAGKDLWIRLQRFLPVRLLDLETGEQCAFGSVPINAIFVDDIKDNKYLVFVEHLSYIQKLIVEQHGPNDGIVKSYVCMFIEEDPVLKNI